nr:MAG TPA: hypothetical protein [Caudoviricetes sp.]
MAVSPSSPSVPLPQVRWAFCGCPCGSPPFMPRGGCPASSGWPPD